MSTPTAISRTSQRPVLRRITRVSGAAVFAIGLFVLIGWLVGSENITRVLPGWVSMKSNSALCFALLGGALFLIGQFSGSEAGLSRVRIPVFIADIGKGQFSDNLSESWGSRIGIDGKQGIGIRLIIGSQCGHEGDFFDGCLGRQSGCGIKSRISFEEGHGPKVPRILQ